MGINDPYFAGNPIFFPVPINTVSSLREIYYYTNWPYNLT